MRVLYVSVARQILCHNRIIDFIGYIRQAYRVFLSLLPVITSEVGRSCTHIYVRKNLIYQN